MNSASVRSDRFTQIDCVPADLFWNANRAFAELVWQRGDGGTTSTRIAEDVHAATGIPTPAAKTNLHAVLAAGVGVAALVAVTRMTDEPALRLLGLVGAAFAAKKAFRYLQQDRCRPGHR
jgi:hypothetical protein